MSPAELRTATAAAFRSLPTMSTLATPSRRSRSALSSGIARVAAPPRGGRSEGEGLTAHRAQARSQRMLGIVRQGGYRRQNDDFRAERNPQQSTYPAARWPMVRGKVLPIQGDGDGPLRCALVDSFPARRYR